MFLLSTQIPLTFPRYNKHIEFFCDLMNDSVIVIINIIFILSMEIVSSLWQQSFSTCSENDLEQVGNCTPAKWSSAKK